MSHKLGSNQFKNVHTYNKDGPLKLEPVVNQLADRTYLREGTMKTLLKFEADCCGV